MTRPLSVLFDPESVAVVGASATPSTWGFHLARGALTGQRRRGVHLVNHHGGSLDGVTFAPSLTAIGAPVDLVVLAVPAASFESVVDEALLAGARAIIGVTAGLSADRVRRVADRIRRAGAVLLGPNCMGVYDAAAQLQLLWGELPAGRITLLSQSGNLAIEMGMIAGRAGLGFSRFASLGNAIDVGVTDLLRVCGADDDTHVVALYLESVGDGRSFLHASAALIDAGTPVILLAAGRSTVGARAAVSHTGVLAGESTVLASACRDVGIVLVDTPLALIEATRVAALRRRSLAGARVGIVGDGGGHGVVAADLIEAAGLQVVPFSEDLAARLAGHLPGTAVTVNPVDLAGGGEQDLWNYARVVRDVAASQEVDAVLLTGYFGAYGDDEPRLSTVEAAVAGEITAAAVPVIVHSMAARSATCTVLTEGGVPVWPAIEHAVGALAALARGGGPDAAARPGVGRGGVTARTELSVGRPPSSDLAVYRGYFGARRLLARYGVRVARAVPLSSVEELLPAANHLGFPVVLKATGPTHKSDVGGVALDLRDPDQLRRAWDRMQARPGTHSGQPDSEDSYFRYPTAGFSVEEMVTLDEGVEMFVGGRRDVAFGPVVAVGFGGVLAELFADTSVMLAPLEHSTAHAAIGRLRGAARLTGFRGNPAVAVDALAQVTVAIGQLLVDNETITDVDVNPVLVTPSGAVALDVHIGWSESC